MEPEPGSESPFSEPDQVYAPNPAGFEKYLLSERQ